MNYLSIDTEYSSFWSANKSKSGELLQVAIVPEIDGVIRKDLAFNEYCRPLTHIWNEGAEKVHKITKKRAMGFQHPSDLIDKLMGWLDQFDDIFTCKCFNGARDQSYIEELIAKYRKGNKWYLKVRTDWYDTYKTAKSKKDLISKKSLTLSSLCEFFSIDIEAHDALSDAIATIELDRSLRHLKSYEQGVQESIESQKTEVEKKREYCDMKYVMLNGEGSIFISEHATKNKEALRIVLEMIWDKYGDD